MGNIQNDFAKSSKWSLLTEVVSKLLPPVVNMILARLLTPEAFGLVATITMVTSFADIFADAGVQKYLIQHHFESDEELDKATNVAFWFNLSIASIFWLLIFVFRNQIAFTVGSPGLGLGISVASAAIPITAFSSIQMARFRRAMDFKTLFFVKVATLFIPLFVTVPLAFALRSYWAIIIGNLVVSVFNSVALIFRSVWKPSFYFEWKGLKTMVRFSFWTFLEQLLGWANLNVGIFIVGVYLSEYYLGLYKTSIAYVNQIMWIIPNALFFVLISAISKMQVEKEDFRPFYYQFNEKVCMVIAPLGIGIIVFRDLFTYILLGSQWYEAASFIGLWAGMYALRTMFGIFNNSIFISCGKPQYSVLEQLLSFAVLVPVLLICAPKGYETLYTARSFVVLWVVFVNLVLLRIFLNMSPIKIVKDALPYMLVAAAMGAVGFTMLQVSAGIVWQFFAVFVCVIVYFSLICVFPRTRAVLMGFIKKNKA